MIRLRLAVAMGVVLGLILFGGLAFSISEVRFEPITLDSSERLLLVPAGQSLSELSSYLESEGMIEAAWKFNAFARAIDAAGQIQAGEYRVRQGELLGALLDRLRSGDVATYKLALVEGKPMAAVIELLRSTDGIVFDEELPEMEALGTWLGLPWPHGEGGILPDTYVYRRGEDGRAILLRAAQALEQTLMAAWSERQSDLPLESPYELLILASLIEKESGTAEDSYRVGRVFVNRLDIGMRLQADPTVIYGMGNTFTGDLLRKHLRQDTPYNTYTRKGLPPTPISIVSRHSLKAAANPVKGTWKYFVARGDGTSEFSTTLREHNQAVRTYVLRR